MTGDFVQHNRMSIQLGKHGKWEKQQKQLQLNSEYERKKELYGDRRCQMEIDDRKKKVFLVHRKQILRNIKSEMEKDKILDILAQKRVRKSIVLMVLQKVYQELRFSAQATYDAKEYRKYEIRCAKKIINKTRNKALRTGPLLKDRNINLIKRSLTLILFTNMEARRRKYLFIVYNFIKECAEIQNVVDKVTKFN